LLVEPFSSFKQASLMLKARKFRHDPLVIEAKANQIIGKLRSYHRLWKTASASIRHSRPEHLPGFIRGGNWMRSAGCAAPMASR